MWKFLVVNQDPKPVDVIIVLRGGDERAAEGVKLFQEGYASKIIFAGGGEKNMSSQAQAMGVPLQGDHRPPAGDDGRIVIITADALGDDVIPFIAEHRLEVLAKPFNQATLQQMVDRMLEIAAPVAHSRRRHPKPADRVRKVLPTLCNPLR